MFLSCKKFILSINLKQQFITVNINSTAIIRYSLFITGFFVVTVLNYQCRTADKVESTSQNYASLDSTTGYVGMQSCRECHQSIYDSYIQTGMGKSFDIASTSKSSGKFDEHQKIYDAIKDFYYQPYWENDSLRIKEFRIEGKDTVHKRIETVSYIVGSGHHTNSHIMNTEGYLTQMPMTFYTQKGHWDLPPGFENGGNSRFNRLIGLECITCHNSYPEFTLGSENKYEFVDNGISCERCHGPGEVHVKDKKAGKIVDVITSVDYSIVNPAKLPIALQMDICQRCHIQGNAVLNEGKSFMDFKPGMKLSDVMNVFMPVYKGREQEHIMASHVERLKLSKCYTVSVDRAEKQTGDLLTPYKNALTCVTCHNPHVSVKQTGIAHFNTSCNGCHTSAKDGLCTEKQEVLSLNKNNCVSCHMPQSGAIDIPHVSVHDHYISIPVKDSTISKIKEFVGINAINNANPPATAKGRAFIAYYEKFNFGKEVLDSAKKYFSDKSTADIRQNFSDLIHIAFLENNYENVIYYVEKHGTALQILSRKSFGNGDAWTSYRIGESYNKSGNFIQAESFYKRAYELADAHPEFANKYATVLSQNNKVKDAMIILQKTIQAYPKYPAALSNYGYLVLVSEGDTAKAMNYYNNALALDPDYEQAILNKVGLLMFTGKTESAKLLLKKFLKRNPDHPIAKELITKLNSI